MKLQISLLTLHAIASRFSIAAAEIAAPPRPSRWVPFSGEIEGDSIIAHYDWAACTAFARGQRMRRELR